ncbi:MAG TPA: glycosyltransferase family 4 protein [Chitinophagaceae bacterium]|nr:glycosyltransferase family 4 protein [Chitinophagaceae bacterium]
MKILIVSQYAQPTGFSRVTRLLAAAFADLFETHVLGIDVYADAAGENIRYKVHCNPFSLDVFAEQTIVKVVDEILPDIVILYHDPWLLHRFLVPMRSCHHRCRKIGYIPVDGYILQSYVFDDITELDALVAFTSFGREVLTNGMKSLGRNHLPPVAEIPHGVAASFYPLNDKIEQVDERRQLARAYLFPHKPALWDGFWVLNANKNQPRKRLDISLEGFALFARDKPPNVKFFLHSAWKSRHLDIYKLITRLQIAKRVISTESGTDQPSLPVSSLNYIYNACDVGINTSLGEGWGLVSVEHAATGAPQVVPDHSASKEIWKATASLLPVRRVCYGSGLLQGGEVSAADVAEALDKLYTDKSYYRDKLMACYQKSRDSRFTMHEIADRWNRLFFEITSDK